MLILFGPKCTKTLQIKTYASHQAYSLNLFCLWMSDRELWNYPNIANWGLVIECKHSNKRIPVRVTDDQEKTRQILGGGYESGSGCNYDGVVPAWYMGRHVIMAATSLSRPTLLQRKQLNLNHQKKTAELYNLECRRFISVVRDMNFLRVSFRIFLFSTQLISLLIS